MTVWVDSYQAVEFLTRRSWTGYLIFLNEYPIYWFSKNIPIIETSTFVSELCAMKQATEYVCGLRYKLRMMVILCDEPTYIYGDNQSVLYNTSDPASQLKKESNSISCHFMREGVARDEWHTTYVNTHYNTSDFGYQGFSLRGGSDGKFCSDYFASFIRKLEVHLNFIESLKHLVFFNIVFYGLGFSVLPSVIGSGSNH